MRGARRALELPDELDKVALRLLRFGFEDVALRRPTLGYEPRSSEQCGACDALWVGSKAGPILRIDVGAAVRQRFLSGKRAARTLKHLHDGGGLSARSVLLIGRDDGFVEIVEDDDGFVEAEPKQALAANRIGFELGALARGQIIDWRTPSTAEGAHRHVHGITAIEAVADGAAHWILVATRAPALHVLRAEGGVLTAHGELAMPGWVEWIVRPHGERAQIECVTRGGHIVRFALADQPWLQKADLPWQSLMLHPTAVLPFQRGLLIGTKRGLAIVNGTAKAIALPITRAPVLCLDRAVLSGASSERYITMGLADGRLRVIDEDHLAMLADRDASPADVRRFSVEIGAPVLALETLRRQQAAEVFVLAIRGDHMLQLYKVQGEAAQRTAVTEAWSRQLTSDTAEAHCTAAAKLLERPGDAQMRSARQNLVVVHVLPLLRAKDADAASALAAQIATTADERVLRALTRDMRKLRDVAQILTLSRAVLTGLARLRDPRPWESAVASHLGLLHRLASLVEGHDRTRLISWARFVRKYIARSQTFMAKRFALAVLVEQNHGNHKFFDALIYHALLAKRCYDLHWEVALDRDVAQLHVLDKVIVVVTAAATLRFLDPAGTPLRVWDGRDVALPGTEIAIESAWTVVPFGLPSPDSAAWTARRRACASVVLPCSTIRIMLSASGENLPPSGVAVIDLRLTDAGVELVDIQAVTTPGEHRVHALRVLPGTSVVIAGLEAPEHPVGRLLCDRQNRWSLEVAHVSAAQDAREDSELAPVAPGKRPTRALAVSALIGGGYLVVAGSDDGQVHVFECGQAQPAARWRVRRWQQLTSAVTSIVLGAHPDVPTGGPVRSCYLATAGGEVLALSIVDCAETGDFGMYRALPLWRETHDSPVVAMHMWQTPLYGKPDDDTQAVLAVATRDGRLILHNHGCFDERRVSMAQNYWFRGKRLERVRMPGPLSALALADDGLVIASGRQVYRAQLVFLRDSPQRDEPEYGAVPAGEALPATMWAQAGHLLARSDVDWAFAAANHVETMLDLCELVPIAALREYALRRRLEPRDAWLALDARAVAALVQRHLRGLDLDRADDAARIKIVLKAVSRAFLWRAPAEVAEVIAGRVWLHHAQTAETCKIVSRYLTHELARATPASARLRIVALKELLRVGVLHHMAKGDDDSGAITAAVKTAFETCLRDDDRVVRIEALRALSVMLRNVRLMAKASPGIVARLFPDGLASLAWAIDPVLERLARFPAHRDAGALISSAWYRLSVLAHVFRLFPDHTLLLCDRIARARRGDDSVRQCLELLQRPSATPGEHDHDLVQARLMALMQLYLFASEDEQLPPIAPHDDATSDAVLAPQLDGMRTRLDALAAASSRARIAEVLAGAEHAAVTDGPFAGLATVIGELRVLGGELERGERGALHRLLALRNELPQRAVPPASIAVVGRILDAWQLFTLEGPPAPSHVILERFTLGRQRDARFDEFAATAAGDPTPYDAVLLWPPDPARGARFARAVDLQRQLLRWSSSRDHVVEVIATCEKPWLGYVARRHDWLADVNLPGIPADERLALCQQLACDIGKVLVEIHRDSDSCHGAISRSTIAIDDRGRTPRYRLGRFEREQLATLNAPVPRFLLDNRGLERSAAAYAQWRDVAALLLVIDEVWTSERLVHADDLARHARRAHELARRAQPYPQLRALATRLRQLLDPELPAFAAGELLKAAPPVGRLHSGHALVIGISRYQRIAPLSDTVHNDAEDVAALLCTEAGYPHANVRVLLDQHASAAGIAEAFAWLAERASSGPCIVYFSGHGARAETSYVLPYDCDPHDLAHTAISQRQLTDHLAAIRSPQLAVFLDACHAAGLGALRPGLDDSAFDSLARGRVIIASSRADKPSFIPPDKSNSLFTHALLKALRRDGDVKILGVFQDISNELSPTQTPVLQSDTEDFVIVRRSPR